MSARNVRFGRFVPNSNTRESRMLAHGRLTVTVTSKRSGQHVTLRLRCKDKEQGWAVVPFAEATHVFIEDFDGERLATYYPQRGAMFYADHAGPAARWSAEALLRYLAGEYPAMADQAEIFGADLCGRCGRQLTDPSSIERGLGPECFGMATPSRHADLRAA